MDERIQDLFNYNPPRLEIFPNHTSTPPSPLTFYDRHIDKNLLLKRVVNMAHIPEALSLMVDRAMKSNDVASSSKESDNFFNQGKRDVWTHAAVRTRRKNEARYLATFYETTTAVFCNSLATILDLFPNVSSPWVSLLRWFAKSDPGTTAQPYITERYALRLDKICADESKLPDCLGQDLKTHLREAYERYPELATWQILDLSVSNEEVIKAMDQVTTWSSFPFQTCLTTGHPSHPNISVPPDAMTTPWTIPPLNTNKIQEEDAPWRNTRSHGHSARSQPNPSTRTTENVEKVIPKRPKKRTKAIKQSVLIAQQLLQHVSISLRQKILLVLNGRSRLGRDVFRKTQHSSYLIVAISNVLVFAIANLKRFTCPRSSTYTRARTRRMESCT